MALMPNPRKTRKFYLRQDSPEKLEAELEELRGIVDEGVDESLDDAEQDGQRARIEAAGLQIPKTESELEAAREVPKDERRVFLLRPLTNGQWYEIQEQMLTAVGDVDPEKLATEEGRAELGTTKMAAVLQRGKHRLLKAVKCCLTGWLNNKTEGEDGAPGEDLEFEEGFIDYLPPEWVEEIGTDTIERAKGLTLDTAKN